MELHWILTTACQAVAYNGMKYFIFTLWHESLSVLLLRCINQIRGSNIILFWCWYECENDALVHSQLVPNVFAVNNRFLHVLLQSHYFRVHKVEHSPSDNAIGFLFFFKTIKLLLTLKRKKKSNSFLEGSLQDRNFKQLKHIQHIVDSDISDVWRIVIICPSLLYMKTTWELQQWVEIP